MQHGEEYIPLSAIGKLLPYRPNRATVYRWIQRGVRSVKLETWLIGGRRFTTARAVQTFIERTSSPAVEAPKPQLQPAAGAERELQRRGVLPKSQGSKAE